MKTVSIRTSLLRNVVALILLMAIALLTVTALGSRKAIQTLSGRLIEQSSNQTVEQLDQYFGNIEDLLRASRAWHESGLIAYNAPDDVQALNGLFIPLLGANPQITSMMVVNDSGFEYLLFNDLRGEDSYKWYNRIVQADVGPDAGFEMLWTEDRELHLEGPLPEDARDYDPRKRPFYTEPELWEIYWTAPYYFFITKDAGMTACYKWQDAETGRTWLVAYDLLLMDLSRFTTSRRLSERGKAFVMLEDESLIGLPADSRWSDQQTLRTALRNLEERSGVVTVADSNANLLTATDFGIEEIQKATEYWYVANKDATLAVDQFRFSDDKEPWWGGFRKFELGAQMLWIGVVIPEADLLFQVRQQRTTIILVSLLALMLGIGMAAILARCFSRPLEQLANQSSRVRELQLSDGASIQSPLTEVQRLAEATEQMMTALDSFARYVPIDLVRELLQRGEVAKIGGTVETLSVLFTDIEGFTSLAEEMDPEQLTAQMADYFGAMLQVLNEEQATIDKFIGDAIVAFWGAPNRNPKHARDAVQSVIRAIEILDKMNAAWAAEGKPELRTRFGLTYGPVLVGNIGAPDRLNYTVLGDTVNLASRLEGLNKYYGSRALATDAMVDAAGDQFVWRHVDRVAVKGREEPVDIYEPLGEKGKLSEDMEHVKKRYEMALQLYFEGQFAEAAEVLESQTVADTVSRNLLERIRELLASPPEQWDGVTRYADK